jgi:hypothetical protein
MNEYDIGDQVELYAAFTSRPLSADEIRTFEEDLTLPEGTGVEPGSVKCSVLKPDGSAGEEATTKHAKGIYKATVEPDQSEVWYAAFDASEGFKAAGEHSFKVRKQRVPR